MSTLLTYHSWLRYVDPLPSLSILLKIVQFSHLCILKKAHAHAQHSTKS